MSDEPQKTEEELLAEWESMAEGGDDAADTPDATAEAAPDGEVPVERLLDQNEIDSRRSLKCTDTQCSSHFRAQS